METKLVVTLDPTNPRLKSDKLGTILTLNRPHLSDPIHVAGTQQERDSVTLSQIQKLAGDEVNNISLFFTLEGDGSEESPYKLSTGKDLDTIRGAIIASKNELKGKFGGLMRFNKKTKEEALKLLEGEVTTYNNWLAGKQYQFEIQEVCSCPTCKQITSLDILVRGSGYASASEAEEAGQKELEKVKKVVHF